MGEVMAWRTQRKKQNKIIYKYYLLHSTNTFYWFWIDWDIRLNLFRIFVSYNLTHEFKLNRKSFFFKQRSLLLFFFVFIFFFCSIVHGEKFSSIMLNTNEINDKNKENTNERIQTIQTNYVLQCLQTFC